jgi:antitoxin CcdA
MAMQGAFFDPNAPKKPTNLSINADLLRLARESQINLSQTLEQCLAEMMREQQRRKWREENREAIDAYNRRITSAGVFSDGLRRF